MTHKNTVSAALPKREVPGARIIYVEVNIRIIQAIRGGRDARGGTVARVPL